MPDPACRKFPTYAKLPCGRMEVVRMRSVRTATWSGSRRRSGSTNIDRGSPRPCWCCGGSPVPRAAAVDREGIGLGGVVVGWGGVGWGGVGVEEEKV